MSKVYYSLESKKRIITIDAAWYYDLLERGFTHRMEYTDGKIHRIISTDNDAFVLFVKARQG